MTFVSIAQASAQPHAAAPSQASAQPHAVPPLQRMSFKEALFQGLAPDGSLYRPEEMPDLRELISTFNKNTSFVDLASAMSSALFPDEMSPQDASALAKRAFPFSPHLNRHKKGLSILELFYGPSYAFKDFGASYLATCMEHFLVDESRRAIILTATSGDTGSAVAQAFYGKKNIDVVILYPSKRISPRQEKQITTLGKNVHALEVNGSFDDCQRMVKEAFVAPELQHLPLTSANSINIGRLIPQSFYYIYAFAQLREQLGSSQKLYFVVPSGNFGNLTAGIYAWCWGLPVDGFVAATNKNDIVPQYLESSVFAPRASLQSYANAMDVGNPSNFERLQAVFHNNWSEMRQLVRAVSVSDSKILETMQHYHTSEKLFICPHTATGLFAAEQCMEPGGHFVTLSTAHPAKFGEIAMEACGAEPPMPQGIADCLTKEKNSTPIDNNQSNLSFYLRNLEQYG